MAGTNPTSNRARIRKQVWAPKRPETHRRRRRPLRLPKSQPSATPTPAPSDNDVIDLVSDYIRGLKLVMSAIVVSVAALRHQNADCDEEIACVLQRMAGDRLDSEIERARELGRISRDSPSPSHRKPLNV